MFWKLLSRCSRKPFRKISEGFAVPSRVSKSERTFSRHLIKRFRYFWQNWSIRGQKPFCLVSTRGFLILQAFSVLEQKKVLTIWLPTFGNLCVLGNTQRLFLTKNSDFRKLLNLMKKIFGKLVIFVFYLSRVTIWRTFRIWTVFCFSVIFWSFLQKAFAGLFRVLSACSEEHFENKKKFV